MSVIKRNVIYTGLFALAMGALEAIVVVYLRQIYYPGVFHFPLTMMSPEMITTEWIREVATIVMLITVALISGRNKIQSLAYFLFAFAVWDIFYYIWLKIFIGWPESFLTWDVLFLIPVVWVGPVLAPLICSAMMIFMSLSILILSEKDYDIKIRIPEWLLIVLGSLVIFYTFVKDYLLLLVDNDLLSGLSSVHENDRFWNVISDYVPERFSWFIFGIGLLLILTAILMIIRKARPK